MKRNIYILLMIASLALSACSGKYEEWYEPQGGDRPTPTSVTFTADSVPPIDLRTLTGDSVRFFRPTITCDKPYTVSYRVTVFNDERTDSVTIKAYNGGRTLRRDLQQVITQMYGPADSRHDLSMNVAADILVEGTVYRGHADSLVLIVTPRREQLAPVWYIMGKDIGDGAWNNSAEGVGTSLIPLYANTLNYAELVYAGYFPAGSEFRIVPEPGSENYIGGGDETGGQSFQDETMEGDPLDNITVRKAGYYRITVNVTHPSNPTIHMEPFDENINRTFSRMAIFDPVVEMSRVTSATSGRNHDWRVSTLSLTNDSQVYLEGEYSIVADSIVVTETVDLGGYAFPAGKVVKGARGIAGPAGNYTLMFNDLMGTYRFIAK